MVGFTEEEVQIIYKMLAAILHLGDIEFGEAAGEDDLYTDNRATIIDTAPLHRGKESRTIALNRPDVSCIPFIHRLVILSHTVDKELTFRRCSATGWV